jgi:hypothetical protein
MMAKRVPRGHSKASGIARAENSPRTGKGRGVSVCRDAQLRRRLIGTAQSRSRR